jgi:hypothetical protein
VKHKVWPLAKGYAEKHEIDFEEVFAPVARMELVRVMPLLRTSTMASGRKPLWPWVTGPSLLLRRYSGSTVVMDRRRLSLLWSIVAMGTMTSATHHYYGV